MASFCYNRSLNNSIEDLPTEILCIIFSFCDAKTLCRISCTCKRFNDILKDDDKIWRNAANKSLITNLISPIVQERTLRSFSNTERCKISSNWKDACYSEHVIQFHYGRYMPWIVLEQEHLWFARGNRIDLYKRKPRGKSGTFVNKFASGVLQGGQEDLSRFVIKDDAIISGGRDGGLYGWYYVTREPMFKLLHQHESDIHDVDVTRGLVISVSRDCTVKMWRLEDLIEKDSPRPQSIHNIDDRVWSVSASPCGNMWAVGSSGHNYIPPLQVYDFHGHKLMVTDGVSRDGAGILDTSWHTPHLLLTCGYDATLKLWDVRTGDSRGIWEDPLDSTLYCIATDHQNTVMCGTVRHARVQVWDLRMRKGLQLYFARAKHSSPVYSISFDASTLFMALDESINMLDFACTGHKTQRRFNLNWRDM